MSYLSRQPDHRPKDKLWTKQVHPKIYGSTWNNGSLGNKMECDILFLIEEEGIRFIKKKAVKTVSPQCWTGTLAWSNNVRAVSTRCLFFLSAMSFCWGVWEQEDWWRMPCTDKKEEIEEEKYYFALSLLRILIVLPNSVLISLTKEVGMDKISYHSFIKKTQVHRENSSMKVMKYL